MEFTQTTEVQHEISVMLALLDKELQKMTKLCKKHQWKYKVIGNNNLEISIPKNSVHLLFYLGHKVLSK